MAVPRRRKKLAETATSSHKAKKPAAPKRPQPSRTKKAVKQTASTVEQIDTAFAIMSRIDEKKTENETVVSRGTVSKRKAITMDRLGFRFHFSLDAVMPDSKDQSDPDLQPNRSSLLDIGLTIPFFWKMPIIGGIAQKVVRNLKTLKI